MLPNADSYEGTKEKEIFYYLSDGVKSDGSPFCSYKFKLVNTDKNSEPKKNENREIIMYILGPQKPGRNRKHEFPGTSLRHRLTHPYITMMVSTKIQCDKLILKLNNQRTIKKISCPTKTLLSI